MNFLYAIYFLLPNFGYLGLPFKAVNRIMAFILKRILDLVMPGFYKKTVAKVGFGLNTEERDETYIVSLTSFPERINEIWITIETIIRQNFKPDKIILWLAEEQFPDQILPESLTNLKKRGLTIEFVEDLRSHKKYFYSMLQYPESNIITLDDDQYYPSNLLKNIVDLHQKYPWCITTNRAHKMTFTNNSINPYRKWKHDAIDKLPSMTLVPTGGAGTLYPPGTLHEEVFNKVLFKALCYHADDLWLKVMSIKKGTNVVTNNRYNKDFVTVGKTQKQKLVSHNVINGGNDRQLKNVLNYYRIDIKDEVNK